MERKKLKTMWIKGLEAGVIRAKFDPKNHIYAAVDRGKATERYCQRQVQVLGMALYMMALCSSVKASVWTLTNDLFYVLLLNFLVLSMCS